MRHAVIVDGVVDNIIELEAGAIWEPPQGATLVAAPDEIGIGWTHASGAFSAPEAPPPSIGDYQQAIQSLLDSKAMERRYDSLQSAASYRDDPNPAFAAEAAALIAWRSAVWTYATAQLALVESGERQPPGLDTLLEELETNCPFAWPGA